MARSPEYSRMLNALKSHGYRVTGPRRMLLRLLAQTTKPLSVHEIYEAVNPSPSDGTGEEINLVTVYRFANLLVELGIARRVEFGQGYYRYERAESQDGPHHHHLVCERCGRVEDFQGCDLMNLTARLEKESGFRVERHQLEVYGTCPTCLISPEQTKSSEYALGVKA